MWFEKIYNVRHETSSPLQYDNAGARLKFLFHEE